MQNPNEDTEWNDILRQQGILPPKKVEPDEKELPPSPDPREMLEKLSVQELDEKCDLLADENIDEEEVRFLEEYRRKRIALMQEEAACRAIFGSVKEVTKSDWKSEVTDVMGVFIVIHIAEKGHPVCALIDEYFKQLSIRFPKVKFMRGESCLCIPNYPSQNLPSILIYKDGDLKEQLIGSQAIGGNSVSIKSLEWRLAQLGVLETKIGKDPSKHIHVKMARGGKVNRVGAHSSGDDDDDSDY